MLHVTWFVAIYTVIHLWLWRYGHCSVPLSDFYDAGNSNCLKYFVNGWRQHIELSTDFDFFGDKYRSMWVTNSGVLVFDETRWPSITSSIPGPVTHLAPFWLHNSWYTYSTRASCWKEVTNGQELERVGDEIISYFPELVNFNVSWMFVVSWIELPQCSWNTSQANTFQAVLVTDGVLTFVIYNYNKIQCASCYWYTHYSQVGFNKGDSTNYYAVEGSGTVDIATVVSRSNVNRTGKFVFRLNGYMARPVKFADILFVIDSSYSETKFFDSVLQYIVNVTDNLIIAPNETQVAVISFSRIAQVEFDFLFCQNKDCVQERVLNISHLNSTSHMDTGLELARLSSPYSDMFLWTKGGRQSALKYVIMVSDGLVNDRDKAKRKARELSQRQGGITVVGVGLGRSVYHTVLESVAFNSSYLLAPDPKRLLQLLQWDLHDRNVTGCVHNYSADILIIVETSASQNDESFKKALTFLQTFLDKINPNHTNNAVTVSVAAYDSTTNYVIQNCQLSSLQYIMDAIRTLTQSQGREQDWDHILRFVDNHTSYSSVTTHKYAMFVTTGSIPEGSVTRMKTQFMHLRDDNSVRVVMVGITDHTNWTVLENVYECGFYTFSTEDVDVVSRVLWNDIKSTNCTKLEK